MKIVNVLSMGAAVIMAGSLAIVMPALAQTAPQGGGQGQQGGWAGHGGAQGGMRGGMPPGVFGTVSAVNGTTLTVTAKARPNATSTSATTSVYTVDASNAKIYKGSATSTVSISDIAVNDMVMVQGTVSGTEVTATVVRDGVGGMMGRPGMPGKGFGNGASSTRPTSSAIIQGNGEPVVGGSVTAVNGATLTITNPGNVVYTVDAASTTIVKNGTSTAITNIAVGDNVIVQGTVDGTSITASSIIDQGVRGGNASSSNASSSKPRGGIAGFGAGVGNIFGAIGGFFQHIFGF